MNNAKPVFKKENLQYERQEKEGYWTFIPKLHPETRELIINQTAKCIIMLCDGSRTLPMIGDVLKQRYPNVDKKRIDMDVATTIASCSRFGIIEWDGDNPFLFKKEEPINENYSMLIAQESDIRRLHEFVVSSKVLLPNSKSDKNTICYKTPHINSREYDELALRQKLFAFHEEYFLLLHEGAINGLISIEMPMYQLNLAARMKIIITPIPYFSHLIQYAQDNFPMLAVMDFTKIRLVESLKTPLSDDLKNLLTKEGYKNEATLEDELGFGEDIRFWSRTYDKKFIAKINAMRIFKKN
jgi:hypothetical protein